MKNVHIIGIDEAGYGPNLGPLVISSSCWTLGDFEEDKKRNEKHYEELQRRLLRCGVIAGSIKEMKTGQGLIAIGDSKNLYQSGDSLDLLRDAVMCMFALTQPCQEKHGALWCLRDVLTRLDSNTAVSKYETPWESQDNPGMVSIDPDTVEKISEAFSREKISCDFLLSRSIPPQEFNEEVRKWDSKGTAHVRWVLGLLRETLDRIMRHQTEDDSKIVVLCDKLGARNRYAPFLYSFFEEGMIHTLCENAQKSEYRFSYAGQNIEVAFHVRGERFLPIALASMTSKWIRETAMEKFNVFWCQKVPNLRPTAGYPVDAKRFLQDIVSVQGQLQIPDDVLWRER